MLIHLTKSNQSLQTVLLILLVLALWAKNFVIFEPIEIIEQQTFLYRSLFEWTKTNLLLAKIPAILCVLLQAFWLNEIVKTHSLSKNPIFVGLIYVVLMSAQSDWQTIQPFIISNFFIIGGLSYLFKIFDKKEPYDYVINASILLALASLISASLLPFGMIVFLIFLLYPINKWREWLIAVLGFGFPFFVLYLWTSLTENRNVFSELGIPIFNFSEIGKFSEIMLPTQLFVIMVLVISVMGTGFMLFRARNNEVSQRKKISAMVLGAFWIVAVALITPCTSAHFATLFIFSAYFIAEWFYRIERLWLAELMFCGFLAVVFCMQFVTLRF